MSAASELNQGLASRWPGPEEALRETEGRFRGIFLFTALRVQNSGQKWVALQP